MEARVQIDPLTYFLWVLWLMLLPLRWVLGVFVAISIHELCHWAVIRASGGKILSFCIGPGGARMETEAMSPIWEIFCALAGPAGSFSLLLIGRYFPEAALIGIMQGLFNLIPVFPLDGGRIARILLPASVCKRVEILVCAALLMTSAMILPSFDLGIWGIVGCIFVIGKVLERKIPCNRRKFGVQ
jgi:Zn-dependent protease